MELEIGSVKHVSLVALQLMKLKSCVKNKIKTNVNSKKQWFKMDMKLEELEIIFINLMKLEHQSIYFFSEKKKKTIFNFIFFLNFIVHHFPLLILYFLLLMGQDQDNYIPFKQNLHSLIFLAELLDVFFLKKIIYFFLSFVLKNQFFFKKIGGSHSSLDYSGTWIPHLVRWFLLFFSFQFQFQF